MSQSVDFFDRQELLNILNGFNPWWTGRASSAPEFRRLAYDACRRYFDNPEIRRAILLSGPRRVGKTTILQQIADELLKEGADPRSLVYLSLDHPLLKLLTISQILRHYHETVYPEGRPATLLLDEVQYSNEWDLQIKHLVDHKPEYRIVATGSASIVHRQRLAESGVGRWIKVSVPTLSFYEFLRFRGEEVPNLSPQLKPQDLFAASEQELAALRLNLRAIQPLFLRYLLVGGFPETARQQDLSLCQRLLREDVVERVLKRDMTALFAIRNVNDLEKVFVYLCLNSGGIFAVQTCASALGISPTTVNNYVESLEQANLIYKVSPLGLGGKKALKAKSKIYLVDAALRNAVLLRGEEIFGDPAQMGGIVETTVLRHLYAYHYQDVPTIGYWRDARSGREVDIIVQSPNYTLPVEVKYQETATLSEKEGIVAFCRETKPEFAYWITKREDDLGVVEFDGLNTRFLRAPAHIFTYLIGQAERLVWSGR